LHDANSEPQHTAHKHTLGERKQYAAYATKNKAEREQLSRANMVGQYRTKELAGAVRAGKAAGDQPNVIFAETVVLYETGCR